MGVYFLGFVSVAGVRDVMKGEGKWEDYDRRSGRHWSLDALGE